jgi:hypothetical protein
MGRPKKRAKYTAPFAAALANGEMRPYAESASEMLEAIVEEIEAEGAPIGPLAFERLQSASIIRMMSRYVFDLAVQSGEPKVAEIATKLATAAAAHLDKAYDLHKRRSTSLKPEFDPLDSMGEPPDLDTE